MVLIPNLEKIPIKYKNYTNTNSIINNIAYSITLKFQISVLHLIRHNLRFTTKSHHPLHVVITKGNGQQTSLLIEFRCSHGLLSPEIKFIYFVLFNEVPEDHLSISADCCHELRRIGIQDDIVNGVHYVVTVDFFLVAFKSHHTRMIILLPHHSYRLAKRC